MKRVLLTDKIAPEAERILEAFGDIETMSIGTPSNSELLEMIPEFEAIIIRSPTKLTAPVIEKADRLKFIGRAGVGVDNIDVVAATKRGIVVMNSPRSNTISTAEHTLAMMLALARDIPRAHESVVAGEWKGAGWIAVFPFHHADRRPVLRCADRHPLRAAARDCHRRVRPDVGRDGRLGLPGSGGIRGRREEPRNLRFCLHIRRNSSRPALLSANLAETSGRIQEACRS